MDKGIWYYTIIVVAVCMLFMSLVGDIEISPWYIRGGSSRYCYVIWHVPKTLKNYTTYRNLKECEKSILSEIERNDW
jgi:hypothetical protein